MKNGIMPLLVGGIFALSSTAFGGDIQINEIRIDQGGTDLDEFFELVGTPSDSLDGLTYIVIGDGAGGSGVIDEAVDLTGLTLDANGYFVAAEDTFTLGVPDLTINLNFENSDNNTHVLVSGFTGAVGDDLDIEDDGMIDVDPPWASVMDAIGLVESPTDPPNGTEYVYGTDLGFEDIGPDGGFVPAHVFRCERAAVWTIGLFGDLSQDTPSAANIDCIDVGISLVKDGPETAFSGDMIDYTLTISNFGISDTDGVVVTDVLPNEVTFVSESSDLGVAGDISNLPTITWAAGTIPAGVTRTVTITVTIDGGAEGFIVNNADVSTTTPGDDPGDNADDAATDVTMGEPACMIINEIHYDPAPTAPEGDANGDGVRDGSDDEFIELVNCQGKDLDISGWTIDDAVATRHEFPPGTIVSDGCSVVVFGGGKPMGTFGGAIVQVASNGFLGFNNGGDTATLRDAGGFIVAEVVYADQGEEDQSITRDPDLTGEFVLHSNAAGAGGALFSPGTMVDGMLFSETCITDSDGDGFPDDMDNCPLVFNPGQEDCDGDGTGDACEDEPDCNENGVPDSCDIDPKDPDGNGEVSEDNNGNGIPDECEFEVPAFVINEIHFDPASDISGDANGDGVRDGVEDEFVEIVNNSGATVDVSGWSISDGASVRHIFPEGTMVPDGCAAVVFGGGTPTGEFGGSVVQIASEGFGLGLNNSGDTVTLLFSDGSTLVAEYEYGAEGVSDESITRDPDVVGLDPMVAHSTAGGGVGTLFSPGTMIDGTAFTCGGGNDCPWDLTGDGDIGPADLAGLLDAWGPNPGNPADFSGNGDVGPEDLAKLLDNWGPCP